MEGSGPGDDAAFTVWLLQRDGRRRLLDGHAEQGMKPSEIKSLLVEFDRRFDPAMIVIESNGMQSYIKEDAIEFDPQLRAKVTGISTTKQKHSWENGIPRLQNLVESGSILFHRGHSATEDFITAMQSLELRNGHLHGHTPDYISSWYMAERGLRRLEEFLEAQEDDEDNRRRSGGIAGF